MNAGLIANNARGVSANDPLGLGTAAGQADVILLARVDPAAHTIYTITIPRDALVAQETPARSPEYLARAVSKLTGLPVDGYVVANFAEFKEAVDIIGGVTVNVKARVYGPQNSGADFQPGVQHMNGSQALAFIRVRQNQAGNSYLHGRLPTYAGRGSGDGLLRNALLDSSRAATLVPRFVAKMKHDVATNVPQDRLVRNGIAMAGAPVYQVPLGSIGDSMVLAHAAIPGIDADGTIDEADYAVLDTSDVQSRLAEFGSRSSSTGLAALPNPATVPIELYGSSHTALHLRHKGFRNVTVAGAATGADRVVYPAAHPEWGWQAARARGTGATYVAPGDVASVVVYE